MNTHPQVHAMIVAAGVGSRFGASIPKQYTIINNQTLLQHSVARLASSHNIDKCLLVIAADDTIANTLNFELPIRYAIGGDERWQSVQAGLKAIASAGAHATDLVLIHDAARPAVPTVDIDSVIAAAKLEPYGAILAAPVADTLKRAENDDKATANSPSYILNTIDRQQIWQAQTPQIYRLAELQRILLYISQKNIAITDEASAFEQLQLPIRLVEGSRQNIKLTFPNDHILLSAILNMQSQD